MTETSERISPAEQEDDLQNLFTDTKKAPNVPDIARDATSEAKREFITKHVHLSPEKVVELLNKLTDEEKELVRADSITFFNNRITKYEKLYGRKRANAMRKLNERYRQGRLPGWSNRIAA